MSAPEITIEHIKQACHWAISAASEARSIAGYLRAYNQKTWDCGTTCCIWGAAWLAVYGRPYLKGVNGPERASWADKSPLHLNLMFSMEGPSTRLEEILAIIAEAEAEVHP